MEEHPWEYLSEDNYEFGKVLLPVRVECLCGRVLEGMGIGPWGRAAV